MSSIHIPSSPIKIVVMTCIFIAGLFLFNTMTPSTEQESLIRVPVEFTGLADSLIISSTSTQSIELLIRGPRKKLANLNAPVFKLSLADAQWGENHVPVSPDTLVLPPSVLILNIQPLSVRVSIDHKISRDLPIDLVYTGSPAKGYRLAGVLANPLTVTVTGPQAVVEKLDKIRTKAVDISGLSESCKKEAAFDIDPALGLILPQGPVLAQVSITEALVVKKMDVPISLPTQSAGVSPSLASIEISGPENRFNGMDIFKDVQISINVDDLKPGVYVRRATISLPVDFTLISVKPELFTLTIK